MEAPPQIEDERIMDIPVHHNGLEFTTCWKLNAEEIEEIRKTGIIWVTSFGKFLQPIYLQTEDPYEGEGKGIGVHRDIVNRVLRIKKEGQEYIFLAVYDYEYDFEVNAVQGAWELQFSIKGSETEGTMFQCPEYLFFEEVIVIGKAIEVGFETDCIIRKMNPDMVLVLQRKHINTPNAFEL